MKKYVFKKLWKKFIVWIFDILGYVVFFPFRLFKKKEIIPEKILVVRLDQIGDMIQALPFVEKLKSKYRSANIYILCARETKFLIEGNENIDKIFVMENSWFYKEKKINFKEIFTLIAELKKENIDVAYDLRGDLRNILLLFFSGIKYIFGYGCAGGGFLLSKEKRYFRDMHEIDKNLNLIDEKSEEEIKIDFKIPEKNIIELRNFFEEYKIKKEDKKIVIHPFSRAPAKMWGIDKFFGLINKIDSKAKIFIVGSMEDRKYIDNIKLKENVFDCVGKFDIRTTIELIKNCDIFIGCDSGLQYFAAYSGLKTCVIYGFTANYLRWKPKVKKENFIGFSKPVECGHCELEKCSQTTHKCMEIISVDEVHNSIKKWL